MELEIGWMLRADSSRLNRGEKIFAVCQVSRDGEFYFINEILSLYYGKFWLCHELALAKSLRIGLTKVGLRIYTVAKRDNDTIRMLSRARVVRVLSYFKYNSSSRVVKSGKQSVILGMSKLYERRISKRGRIT